jgi:fatty acid desaturase
MSSVDNQHEIGGESIPPEGADAQAERARAPLESGATARRPRGRLLKRREDLIPIAYLTLIYATLLVFFFHFTAAPWWAKAVMFWVGVVLSARTESILHWTTHFPAFHSRWLNQVHRLYYSLLPRPALWYAHHHFQHHRFDNSTDDLSTTLDNAGRQHLGLIDYLLLSFTVPDVGPVLEKMPVAQRRECTVSFSLSVAFVLGLGLLDWYATLLFWLPVTWLVSTVLIVLYNYTDHVPSNPANPMLYATYDPLRTSYRRFLSFLDLHNVATHITHHRFPGVYWSELPRKQEAWLPTYTSVGTPRTYALNSAIVANPFALILMSYRVHRARSAIPVTSASVASSGLPGAGAHLQSAQSEPHRG